MSAIAKVFRNGASQAVRLPKEFRFDTDEVCIKRIGTAVLLYPKDGAWDLMAGVIGRADDVPKYFPRALYGACSGSARVGLVS